MTVKFLIKNHYLLRTAEMISEMCLSKDGLPSPSLVIRLAVLSNKRINSALANSLRCIASLNSSFVSDNASILAFISCNISRYVKLISTLIQLIGQILYRSNNLPAIRKISINKFLRSNDGESTVTIGFWIYITLVIGAYLCVMRKLGKGLTPAQVVNAR